jgi:hypothetical protein
MDPMTFLSRLAALIPPPRRQVLSYYGVLGAAAARRDEIVPPPSPEDAGGVPHSCGAGKAPAVFAGARSRRVSEVGGEEVDGGDDRSRRHLDQ